MIKILTFLDKLQQNNNREWFAEHKKEYEIAKDEFERIASNLILRISEFDPSIKNVDVKDCVFRIYRDIRFSHDKTPYKTHFGVFIASQGGRKSDRAGYYLHIAPHNQSFFGAGSWMPPSPLLRVLRQNMYDNFDEFEEIRNEADFKQLYGDSYLENDKLKKLPAGFSADFPEPEILKLKHYLVSHDLSEKDLEASEAFDTIVHLAQTAYPFVHFLNYAIDEENL